MKRFQFPSCQLSLLLLLVLPASLTAHSPSEDMAEAAARFLAALSPEQRAQCTFALDDKERFNWHFVPRPRKGISFKDLTAGQGHLVHALLASGLSQRGYLKAATIMSIEQVLKELEQGRGPVRDSELFYVSIFGKPGGAAPWGWRVEGHHLSINITVGGENVGLTPSFFGSNPAEVRSGPRKGLRVLAAEEDLARKLVRSLDEEQRKAAVFSDRAPADIITGADRRARVLTPLGLSAGKMTSEQAELLWTLIKEYLHRYRPELAAKDLEKAEQGGLEKIHFAWAGSLEPGQGHYYRVQGESFLMEYDNTQDGANHVHTVWRDLANDFGEDLLRRHYDQDHRP